MVYKVSVKRTWRFNDGSRLEPGMSVNVQSKQTSAANLLNAGMQDVSDAFMRNYGVSISRTQFGFANNYLDATKI
jgi:hypothetical protein